MERQQLVAPGTSARFQSLIRGCFFVGERNVGRREVLLELAESLQIPH